MSGVAFDRTKPGVRIVVYVAGPQGGAYLNLAVDTGAMMTTIKADALRRFGCDPDRATARRRMTTASGIVDAPVVVAETVFALGLRRSAVPVIAHDFPPTFTADGLLGLDFFRGQVLTLDFARGRIRLGPPRTWWPLW